MKIIVGLGNPDKKYQKTRHNTGFMFVDALAECREIAPVGEKLKFQLNKKFEAEIAETTADGEKIILVKPQTYMNYSGKAVSKIIKYYKAELKDLIVVHDDVDLPIGILRVRQGGSSGGQKGLQNILDLVGEDDFFRFRIGISQSGEKKDQIETTRYVLESFSNRELPVIKQVISLGTNYFIEYLIEKKEMPSHTLEVVQKEESPRKI